MNSRKRNDPGPQEGCIQAASDLSDLAKLDAAKAPVRSNTAAPGSPTRTATGTGKDLPNLDVLRAVAVLCVLAHHILQQQRIVPYGMGFGGFGVGLFFVHTALVLMWSLERRPNTIDFYIRRIWRIYPLSMVVLLVVVAIRLPVNSYGAAGPFFLYHSPSIAQVFTHLFLVQNLFSGNFILYVMWSLPLEVQMYILLPPLFFFLRSHRSLWPLLLFWVLAIAFVHREFGPQELNLASSIPYFLPGLMAYVGFSHRKARLPGWSFLILLGCVVFVGGRMNNWLYAAFPCLVLGLFLPSFRQMRSGIFTRTAWVVARYSYGIYLLHPVSLALAFYFGRGHSLALQLSILFGSLIVFSLAAYHLIEAPCIRMGARVAKQVAERGLLAPQGSAA